MQTGNMQMRMRSPAMMQMSFNMQPIAPVGAAPTPVPQTLAAATRGAPAVRSRGLVGTTPEKTMKWGTAVWVFYHTLAYKIHEDAFPALRDQLINFIRGISSVLPCPRCSEHATAYMNKVNFAAIQTKEQLKQMLNTFHNTVNGKKGYVPMSPAESDEKYRLANTGAVIRHFLTVFPTRQNNVRLLTDQMHRESIVAKLGTWLQANIAHFDP
jgi:hypothetical protein